MVTVRLTLSGVVVAQVDLVSISGRSSILNIQLPSKSTLLHRISNEVESGAPLSQVIVSEKVPSPSSAPSVLLVGASLVPAIKNTSNALSLVDFPDTFTVLSSTREIDSSISDPGSALIKCCIFVAQYCVASVVPPPPPVVVPVHASYVLDAV